MTAKAPQHKPEGPKRPPPPPKRYIIEGKSIMPDLRPGKIEISHDVIAEKLDELADLCSHWQRNRARDIQPNGIRAGILYLIDEIMMLAKSKAKGA